MSKKKHIALREIRERITALFGEEDIVVYGVPKGGSIIAGMMASMGYQVAWTESDPAITTIVDDLVDSGTTREYYKNRFPDRTFVPIFNKLTEPDIKNYWLVFPWEEEHPGEEEDNIQDNITRILQYIGEDPNREGLIETPKRVVRMWGEIFRGYDSEKTPKISIFKNGSDGLVYDQMIIDSGDFYSHCEHHMVPFFGKYWFGYVPDPAGGIIGLSKVARVVDYYAAKLQIQERLVHDIVEHLWKELTRDGLPQPLGMGLVMKGEHLCKTMRGAKKKGLMTTTKLKGVFLNDFVVRQEFLRSIE